MVDTLIPPFIENKGLIVTGDIIRALVKPYTRRYGFVERFKTLCFMGQPIIKMQSVSGVRIKHVSWSKGCKIYALPTDLKSTLHTEININPDHARIMESPLLRLRAQYIQQHFPNFKGLLEILSNRLIWSVSPNKCLVVSTVLLLLRCKISIVINTGVPTHVFV